MLFTFNTKALLLFSYLLITLLAFTPNLANAQYSPGDFPDIQVGNQPVWEEMKPECDDDGFCEEGLESVSFHRDDQIDYCELDECSIGDDLVRQCCTLLRGWYYDGSCSLEGTPNYMDCIASAPL